jgi:hypothetical protein
MDSCWFQVNLHWSMVMRHLGVWSVIGMFALTGVGGAQVATDNPPLPAPAGSLMSAAGACI